MALEVGAIHIHERPKEFAIVGNEAITRFAALVREEALTQRKPLTELQITEIYTKWESTKGTSWADLIRAIEAAHGIKE